MRLKDNCRAGGVDRGRDENKTLHLAVQPDNINNFQKFKFHQKKWIECTLRVGMYDNYFVELVLRNSNQ